MPSLLLLLCLCFIGAVVTTRSDRQVLFALEVKSEDVFENIRLNIMFTKRKWYFLYLIKTFKWIWNKGFEPPFHRDAKLWLTEWQGSCGKALKDEDSHWVDLRNARKLKEAI